MDAISSMNYTPRVQSAQRVNKVQNDNQNAGYCKACKSDFIYEPDAVKFDEQGYGYSIKYTLCPYCGRIVILKYFEDKGLNVNFDDRYYE